MKRYFFPFLCFLALTLLAYLPGIQGTFLLDDFDVLSTIASWVDLRSWEELLSAIISSNTGPTGRPVAIISFYLQGAQWPTSPKFYLLINISIHILNGLLLYVFLSKILEVKKTVPAAFLAFLAAVIWLLHPMHLSTVLYVVQRMALLAMTFNLAALIAYIFLRKACIENDVRLLLIWGVVLSLSILLAVGSKENTALIPLQLMFLELCFFRSDQEETSHLYLALRYILVYVPSFLLVGYLLKITLGYSDINHIDWRRSFSVYERLLTETRVVGDYVENFFLPNLHFPSVFHDGYHVSSGLLQPVSTLLWAVFHLAVLFLALLSLKRIPVVAFAILWFYINHIIESSVVQLELKFEHRNYMPSVGLALLAAFVINGLGERKKQFTCVLLMFVLTGILASRAKLWGQPLEVVKRWVAENPESTRAHHHAAEVHIQLDGNRKLAKAYYRRSVTLSNYDPALELRYLHRYCDTIRLSDNDVSAMADRYRRAQVNGMLDDGYRLLLTSLASGQCRNISYPMFEQWIEASIGNANYDKGLFVINLLFIKAQAELLMGDEEKGLALFRKLMSEKTIPLSYAFRQADFLMSIGQKELALILVERSLSADSSKKFSRRFMVARARRFLAGGVL